MDRQIPNSPGVPFVLRAGCLAGSGSLAGCGGMFQSPGIIPAVRPRNTANWCPGQAAWIWVRLTGCIRKERKGE